MRRHGGLETLAGVLGRDRFVRRVLQEDTTPLSTEAWRECVGVRIAERSRPVKIDRGTLYVHVVSPVWAQELSLLSETITARLRAGGLEVSQIRFTTKVFEPARKLQRVVERVTPKVVTLPASLEAAASRIADPELADAVRKAAQRQLGFSERDPKPRGKR